ncbi:unnamed protein product [Rhodiola kirilowii]
MDEDEVNGICEMCGGGRFVGGNDGYYYCTDCHHQSQDVMDTGVAEEDFANTGADGFYLASHRRREHASAPGLRAIKAEPISQFVPDSYVPGFFGGSGVKKEEVAGEEFNGPIDFGFSLGYEADDQKTYKYTYSEVRMRYVMGIQLMLEMQCTALVENFGVNPLICGLASSIWLRFVAASEVFDDGWADNAISESEAKQPGIQEDIDRPPRYFREFRNSHGERAVMIWYKSLRKMIPLSSSLAVSYLACHVARESILPTHILKWTLEGKLPYLVAFTEIQKVFPCHPSRCPLSACFMFRPSEVVPTQKLEAMAAKVADIIGLDLPPVNFHEIASKYLKQLSLPVEEILQRADCIVDWSMPPELWLSVNELRLPTRVYVMAVLIVSIRIFYNIHGFGVWEKSLSNRERKFDSSCEPNIVSPSCSVAESPTKSKGLSMLNNDSCPDAGELLCNLEAKYGKLLNNYEYSKDLPTYLNYNKNVIFGGIELSNDDEKTIAEELWDIYLREPEQNEEFATPYDNMRKGKRSRDYETPHDGYSSGSDSDSKRIAYSGDASTPSAHGKSFHLDDHSEQSYSDDHAIPRTPNDPSSPAIDHQAASKNKEEAINRLKADMEENRFCYIPPRINVKRHDYLHYVRKKDGGAYTYVAHADYYILLRSCARVAEVDIRLMHMGVMNLERRLAWIEKRIDHCLKFRPPDVENGDCNEIDSQHECPDEVSLGD